MRWLDMNLMTSPFDTSVVSQQQAKGHCATNQQQDASVEVNCCAKPQPAQCIANDFGQTARGCTSSARSIVASSGQKTSYTGPLSCGRSVARLQCLNHHMGSVGG